MISEYVDLKIKRDGLTEALQVAVTRGEQIEFIRLVQSSLKAAEQSMKEWLSVNLLYN
jgi:hypothetical protein